MTCVKCRLAEVPANEKGRPNVYCSTVCRRAAEFEVRRIDRHLMRLEERLSNTRSLNPDLYTKAQLRRDTDLVEEEIKIAEARLRVLLGNEPFNA